MILTVLGARPQFVKAAVVSKALAEVGIEEKVVHTGQHYDEEMSGVFWKELSLPAIYANLEAGSGTHGKQTAHIIEKTEELIIRLNPKAVMVYGDTNSTIGAAIAASKFSQIKIIHVEAGLRSFNRDMPEEINRVVTDHLSHLLFCSSSEGVMQLEKEGVTKNVFETGDVMHDCLKMFQALASKTPFKTINQEEIRSPFILMTIHRPSNTDNPENLQQILKAVAATNQQVIWPIHPRNKSRLDGLLPENILAISPVSYLEMLKLLHLCNAVITDSGGLQKEAYWMQKPCITVRTETEWVETLQKGANQLTGPNTNEILKAYGNITRAEWIPDLYGDGKASQKIAAIIREHL